MGLIDLAIEALRSKETIFLKETSDLQDKYDALEKLNSEYPNNEELLSELYIVKKGLYGENEIAYQLKKANIGMYVLRDIKLQYKDLTAQIDYVIITPVFTYYVECKNLVGNITVNEKGDFIREFTINGRKIKKGIYSPLRQVEAQREVVRMIWNEHINKLQKVFAEKNFEYYRRVLVVAANQDTILNTSKAPSDIKYKVLRADNLIRQIKYEINNRTRNDDFDSQKTMESLANTYLKLSVKDTVDYYEYYKNKFSLNKISNNTDNLRDRLIELRKKRAYEMNIPPYYVFNNDELNQLIKIRPQSIEELVKSNILSSIKVKTHGIEIINEITKK